MSTDLIRFKLCASSQYVRSIVRVVYNGRSLSESTMFFAARETLSHYLDFQLDYGTDLLANLAYIIDNTDEDWPWWPSELIVNSDWLITRELLQDFTVFACKSLFWKEHEAYFGLEHPKDRPLDTAFHKHHHTSAMIRHLSMGIREIRPVAQRLIDTTPVRESPRLVWVPDDEVMTPLGLPAGMGIHWWYTPIEEPDGSDGGVPWAMGKGAPGVWL